MTEPNITPLARRLAEENGIDWRNLEGSGPDGTIVERDILAFLAKVMAGEVELPPQPEDAQPPEEIPDITQVQEALAREGVDLEEIVPGITSETMPKEPAPPAEEEVLFEMDFEEEFSFEEEPAPPVEPPAPVEEPAEGYFAAEPPAPPVGEAPPEEAGAVGEPPAWEAEPAGTETPEQALEELEEEFSWEAAVDETPVAEEAAPTGEAEAFDESAGWELVEEPEPQTGVEPAAEAFFEESFEEVSEPAAEAVEPAEAEESAPEPAETFEAASFEEEAGFEEEPHAEEEAVEEVGEPAAAAAAHAVFPPAFRRAVSLDALEKARGDLSEAWKKEVPASLLLLRAVERALAELEVPMRAVLGRLEGDTVSSYMVYPADNLRALFDNYLSAGEPADGLVVIDLGETPYAEVLLPDAPLVTLGYTGMPEGLGLLSVSGELPTDRTRFLERVAFYLERPILLA